MWITIAYTKLFFEQKLFIITFYIKIFVIPWTVEIGNNDVTVNSVLYRRSLYIAITDIVFPKSRWLRPGRLK